MAHPSHTYIHSCFLPHIFGAVGIVTGYGPGWSSDPCRVKYFLFSMSSRPALGPTQSLIQWVPEALSSGLERLRREADHLLPTSAEVKKT
jgi:hypothetical protein